MSFISTASFGPTECSSSLSAVGEDFEQMEHIQVSTLLFKIDWGVYPEWAGTYEYLIWSN